MYSFTQIADNIKSLQSEFKAITKSFGQVGSVSSAKKKMFEVLTLLDKAFGYGCYTLTRDSFEYVSYHEQFPEKGLSVEHELNGYLLAVTPKEYLADIYELLVTLGFGRLTGDAVEVAEVATVVEGSEEAE